jgi:hypothetical protein
LEPGFRYFKVSPVKAFRDIRHVHVDKVSYNWRVTINGNRNVSGYFLRSIEGLWFQQCLGIFIKSGACIIKKSAFPLFFIILIHRGHVTEWGGFRKGLDKGGPKGKDVDGDDIVRVDDL